MIFVHKVYVPLFDHILIKCKAFFHDLALHEDSGQAIAKGINAIIDTIQEKLPNTKLILHRIFPRGRVNDPLRIVNDLASSIVAARADNESIYYVDINQKFLDENGHVPISIMGDGLHLTAEGY